MPGVSKIIKNRIKSVGSARNITKAMELIAAAKIKRAVSNLMASRVYARHALELLANLSKEANIQHPLLQTPPGKKELLIIIASNRGLCGSYNINVVKTATQYIRKNKDVAIDIIVVGRKAEAITKNTRGKVIASFIKFPDDLHAEDINPLFKIIIDEFTKKTYSKVSIAFTDFISSLKYEAKIATLLPIAREDLPNLSTEKRANNRTRKAEPVILFEPSETAVLDLVLPRLTAIRIYQAFLEANASEHSSRMMAMKNASDSAKAMIDELTLYYNQARQAGITQEIAEISGGTEALNSDN